MGAMFDDALDPALAHEVSTDAADWLAMARGSRHPRAALAAAWLLVPLAWLSCTLALLQIGPVWAAARAAAVRA